MFIFIVNVHLEGEPKKWAVRFKQIKSILSRITFRCTELGLDALTIPVVICGDFNDSMHSAINKVRSASFEKMRRALIVLVRLQLERANSLILNLVPSSDSDDWRIEPRLFRPPVRCRMPSKGE